jgi:hypothetical protein
LAFATAAADRIWANQAREKRRFSNFAFFEDSLWMDN